MLDSKISRVKSKIAKNKNCRNHRNPVVVVTLQIQSTYNSKGSTKICTFRNTFGKQTTFIDSFGLVKNLFDGLITIIIIGKRNRTERSEKEESQNSTPFF